jgi:hypothetical protein
MRSKRKLGIIALAASIAAILLAVPVFTATNIINGVSIPASTNRFAMMAIIGRSTKTAATNWHPLTPTTPVSLRSVSCKRVVVNPAKNSTTLPSLVYKKSLCVQLTVAGGVYNQWRLYPPISLLSKHDQEDVIPHYVYPGLSLSSSGVLTITPKIDSAETSQPSIPVEASNGHGHITTILWIYVHPPNQGLGNPALLNHSWAGYVMQGGTFNGVSATFNVPRATSVICNRDAWHRFCDEAVWTGIDGGSWFGGNSIIQAGINERVIAGTHKISHLGAWFELYPAPNLRVNLPIHQGDQVSVNIHETVTSNLWLIRITNDTTGQTFSTLQFYTGSTSSAEWIVEAPGWANFPLLGSRSFSLPTLSPVTFTHPKYSLSTKGKGTWSNSWGLFQRHTHALASRWRTNGSFTVTSFPTTSKRGKP